MPLILVVLLTGCGPGLKFNISQDLSTNEILHQSTHVFIGVIESHHFDHWPFLPVARDHGKYWKVLRRRVRLEIVAKGEEFRPVVDIYEYFWTGGASGDWNFTEEGKRYIFPVKNENGRYHVVRDWWRSIFPVRSGRHNRLPLDDFHSLQERLTLLLWWPKPDATRFGSFFRMEIGDGVSEWRRLKLLRGLTHHPNQRFASDACIALIDFDPPQDECWDFIKADEDMPRTNIAFSRRSPVAWRRYQDPVKWWKEEAGYGVYRQNAYDTLRFLTTTRIKLLREKYCAFFLKTFPSDPEHGCPADQAPPSTVVTEQGDVPYRGMWPQQ